jgi:hypothetical protein
MMLHRVLHLVVAAGIGISMPAERTLAHDVHLTHTRMIVDGSRVICRIRFFRDDLERALHAEPGAPVTLPAGAALDSLVARYVATRFVVTADGKRLAGRLTGSGEEHDTGGQPMRWIVLELDAERPVTRLVLRDALLFETFSDQQNVVSALRTSDDKRQSLYFIAGKAAEQQVVP